MKILVVDDSRDNIELVTEILESVGHQLISATDGSQGLELARKEQPDLAILDVNMPGMSGLELCAALKSDEKTSNTSVIMLTALGDVEKRIEALKLGAEDYLTKPFSPRELIARVERRLRAKVATDDLREKQALISKTFARFVAAPIVDQLLQRPDDVKLGGKLQEVTVLFADLENFTSLSEKIDPVDLLKLLNSYHALIVKVIQQYRGTIDKFIGDAVMALYNTPLEQPDHVEAAVKTALHIQNEMHYFHEDFPPEYRLQINFGIHTGIAIVGNVGTSDIMDFTAVGDTVNIASRLQGLSHRGQILVSEAVYRKVDDFVIGRSMGPLTVKGRTEPVMTYIVSDNFLG